jgi:hypothetical protein
MRPALAFDWLNYGDLTVFSPQLDYSDTFSEPFQFRTSHKVESGELSSSLACSLISLTCKNDTAISFPVWGRLWFSEPMIWRNGTTWSKGDQWSENHQWIQVTMPEDIGHGRLLRERQDTGELNLLISCHWFHFATFPSNRPWLEYLFYSKGFLGFLY